MMFTTTFPLDQEVDLQQQKLYVKSLICSVTPACHEGGTAAPREEDKHLKRGMKEASNISAACKIDFCFQLSF